MIDILQWRSTIGSFHNVFKIKIKFNYKIKKGKFGNTFFILMVTVLLNAQFENSYSKYLANENNQYMHTLNGNISQKGTYKFLHINKGNSNFETKLDDIYNIIDIHKPDIMSIQEANYNIEQGIKIRGYNIEFKRGPKG